MASGTAMDNDGWTTAALEARTVRYADLRPCYNAFIDCRTPGSEAKENFTIIGPGVSENPQQHVHIAEPHGFNIGGARQPPGCVNSQHSHQTAEVFVVHSGAWRFDLGEHGNDAQIHLRVGDVISIPTNVFRGFTATAPAADGSPGYLWAVLGQDDPGRVTWAPDVFQMAQDYGLVLLENGQLIDTVAGERKPEGAAALRPTTAAEAASLRRLSDADTGAIVWRNGATAGDGVTPIIGDGAPLDWPHGFWLDRIDVAADEEMAWDESDATDVLFVQRGDLRIACADGDLIVGPGDTISLPAGLPRSLASDTGAVAYLVGRA